jgi:type VI secretion system protein ImpK
MATPPPDDPFAPSDATILRPRPGRRPAGAAAPTGPAAAGSPGAASSSQPLPAPRYADAPPPPGGPGVAEFVATGRNPIVQSAVPLLILAGRLRGLVANADVESLRRQCIQEMRAFEERTRQGGVPAEDVLAARYALCTVIDEAVLNTPWGAQSGWASQSLLVTFHREAQGGEKFFQILDRLVGEPQRYIALLELWYSCLALGFEGRYRLDERGANRLADIRHDLYRRIEQQRGAFEAELSPRWKGVEDRRNAVLRLVPLWVVAVACAALLIGAYIFFNSRLNGRSAALDAELANMGLTQLAAPTAAQRAAPTSGLAQLLAPQVAAGMLQIQEQGTQTTITVTVPNLFASGSAAVNPRFQELVHQIGTALNGIPGRIIVTGHTDDQPVRSFQYHNNYELSQARAQQVTQLLKANVTDATRIESAGKGDSEPLYQPPNLPENRARNRRVVIVHRRDG